MEVTASGQGRSPVRLPEQHHSHNIDQADGSAVVMIEGKSYAPHCNGGGLVAHTAIVDESVFVSPTATVRDFAQVRDHVRLLNTAIVEGHAIVTGDCEVRKNAVVGDEAHLSERVLVTGNARVGGQAILSGFLTIGYFAYVGESSRISGDLMIE